MKQQYFENRPIITVRLTKRIFASRFEDTIFCIKVQNKEIGEE